MSFWDHLQLEHVSTKLYFIIDQMIVADLGIGMVNKLNAEGDIN